jgi:hypothetical protein
MCRTTSKNERDRQLMISGKSSSSDLHAVVAGGTRRISRARTADFTLALRKAAEAGAAGATGSPAQADRHSSLRGQALKVRKSQSHGRIRKPSRLTILQRPANDEFKPPVIIHTFAPKIIHTNPESFMSLVQKLTGSSFHHTRRLRRCRLKVDGSTSHETADNVDALLLDQSEHHNSSVQIQQIQQEQQLLDFAAVSSPASSTSSEEAELQSTRFASSSGLAAKKNILKQCGDADDLSPKGPLSSYLESQQLHDPSHGELFWNPCNMLFSASASFDQVQAATINPWTAVSSKREPLSLAGFDCFSDQLGFLAADRLMGTSLDDYYSLARTCSASSTRLGSLLQSSHQIIHDQELHTMMKSLAVAGVFGASGSTLMSASCIDAGSYPKVLASASSGNDLSPELMIDNLPADLLSPSCISPSSSTTMWSSSSSSSSLDNCNWNSMGSTASRGPLPFAHSGYSPTPGTMVSLRDIQAINIDAVDDLVLISRGGF